MKTRTLLLLALGCGLAIMLAGAVFLFQLNNRDDIAEPTPLGQSVTVGDMSVAVDDAVETAGTLAVTVRLGGVDDEDGGQRFRLIASGRPLEAEPPGVDGCSSTAIAVRVCVVRFDVTLADGISRVLFYERGDDRARWVLG